MAQDNDYLHEVIQALMTEMEVDSPERLPSRKETTRAPLFSAPLKSKAQTQALKAQADYQDQIADLVHNKTESRLNQKLTENLDELEHKDLSKKLLIRLEKNIYKALEELGKDLRAAKKKRSLDTGLTAREKQIARSKSPAVPSEKKRSIQTSYGNIHKDKLSERRPQANLSKSKSRDDIKKPSLHLQKTLAESQSLLKNMPKKPSLVSEENKEHRNLPSEIIEQPTKVSITRAVSYPVAHSHENAIRQSTPYKRTLEKEISDRDDEHSREKDHDGYLSSHKKPLANLLSDMANDFEAPYELLADSKLQQSGGHQNAQAKNVLEENFQVIKKTSSALPSQRLKNTSDHIYSRPQSSVQKRPDREFSEEDPLDGPDNKGEKSPDLDKLEKYAQYFDPSHRPSLQDKRLRESQQKPQAAEGIETVNKDHSHHANAERRPDPYDTNNREKWNSRQRLNSQDGVVLPEKPNPESHPKEKKSADPLDALFAPRHTQSKRIYENPGQPPEHAPRENQSASHSLGQNQLNRSQQSNIKPSYEEEQQITDSRHFRDKGAFHFPSQDAFSPQLMEAFGDAKQELRDSKGHAQAKQPSHPQNSSKIDRFGPLDYENEGHARENSGQAKRDSDLNNSKASDIHREPYKEARHSGHAERRSKEDSHPPKVSVKLNESLMHPESVHERPAFVNQPALSDGLAREFERQASFHSPGVPNPELGQSNPYRIKVNAPLQNADSMYTQLTRLNSGLHPDLAISRDLNSVYQQPRNDEFSIIKNYSNPPEQQGHSRAFSPNNQEMSQTLDDTNKSLYSKLSAQNPTGNVFRPHPQYSELSQDFNEKPNVFQEALPKKSLSHSEAYNHAHHPAPTERHQAPLQKSDVRETRTSLNPLLDDYDRIRKDRLAKAKDHVSDPADRDEFVPRLPAPSDSKPEPNPRSSVGTLNDRNPSRYSYENSGIQGFSNFALGIKHREVPLTEPEAPSPAEQDSSSYLRQKLEDHWKKKQANPRPSLADDDDDAVGEPYSVKSKPALHRSTKDRDEAKPRDSLYGNRETPGSKPDFPRDKASADIDIAYPLSTPSKSYSKLAREDAEDLRSRNSLAQDRRGFPAEKEVQGGAKFADDELLGLVYDAKPSQSSRSQPSDARLQDRTAVDPFNRVTNFEKIDLPKLAENSAHDGYGSIGKKPKEVGGILRQNMRGNTGPLEEEAAEERSRAQTKTSHPSSNDIKSFKNWIGDKKNSITEKSDDEPPRKQAPSMAKPQGSSSKPGPLADYPGTLSPAPGLPSAYDSNFQFPVEPGTAKIDSDWMANTFKKKSVVNDKEALKPSFQESFSKPSEAKGDGSKARRPEADDLEAFIREQAQPLNAKSILESRTRPHNDSLLANKGPSLIPEPMTNQSHSQAQNHATPPHFTRDSGRDKPGPSSVGTGRVRFENLDEKMANSPSYKDSAREWQKNDSALDDSQFKNLEFETQINSLFGKKPPGPRPSQDLVHQKDPRTSKPLHLYKSEMESKTDEPANPKLSALNTSNAQEPKLPLKTSHMVPESDFFGPKRNTFPNSLMDADLVGMHDSTKLFEKLPHDKAPLHVSEDAKSKNSFERANKSLLLTPDAQIHLRSSGMLDDSAILNTDMHTVQNSLRFNNASPIEDTIGQNAKTRLEEDRRKSRALDPANDAPQLFPQAFKRSAEPQPTASTIKNPIDAKAPQAQNFLNDSKLSKAPYADRPNNQDGNINNNDTAKGVDSKIIDSSLKLNADGKLRLYSSGMVNDAKLTHQALQSMQNSMEFDSKLLTREFERNVWQSGRDAIINPSPATLKDQELRNSRPSNVSESKTAPVFARSSNPFSFPKSSAEPEAKQSLTPDSVNPKPELKQSVQLKDSQKAFPPTLESQPALLRNSRMVNESALINTTMKTTQNSLLFDSKAQIGNISAPQPDMLGQDFTKKPSMTSPFEQSNSLNANIAQTYKERTPLPDIRPRESVERTPLPDIRPRENVAPPEPEPFSTRRSSELDAVPEAPEQSPQSSNFRRSNFRFGGRRKH